MSKRKKVQPLKQRQAPQAMGITTPAQRVESLTIRRTIKEDEKFGESIHAMQILPNGQVLLLFESDGAACTRLLGEEVIGFDARPYTDTDRDSVGEAGES